MGRRSRKRAAAGGATGGEATTRAERDAARQARGDKPRRRRGRPTIDERPPAPWGNFPLVEIAVFLAIVFFVAGLVIGGERGQILLTGALGLGSLAGLELSIREHFAGYRSHTTLLAAACAFLAMAATFFAAGRGDLARALLLPVT